MKKNCSQSYKIIYYLDACSVAPCTGSLGGVCLLGDVAVGAVTGTTDGVAESVPLDRERVPMGDLKQIIEMLIVISTWKIFTLCTYFTNQSSNYSHC